MESKARMNQTDSLPELTDELYFELSNWLKAEVGVDLGDTRKTMMAGRLAKVLNSFNIPSIQELRRIIDHPDQIKLKMVVIDNLTTHETYFFRESEHIDFLEQIILPKATAPFNVWSAACSTGEEAFTLGLILAEHFRSMSQWEILGTDISSAVVAQSQRGLFPNSRLKLVPGELLKKYFKKGINQQEGNSVVTKELKDHLNFKVDNLLDPKTQGPFNVIFCRNVLIYFDNPTKQKVIHNLLDRLKPGGYLISGRCEPIRQFAKNAKVINHSILKRV